MKRHFTNTGLHLKESHSLHFATLSALLCVIVKHELDLMSLNYCPKLLKHNINGKSEHLYYFREYTYTMYALMHI